MWRVEVWIFLSLLTNSRFVFNGVDDLIEFGEQILFVGIIGFEFRIAEDVLELLLSNLSSSFAVQHFEHTEEFIFWNFSHQLIDIIEVKVAFLFDIYQFEESWDLGVAEFVELDGFF